MALSSVWFRRTTLFVERMCNKATTVVYYVSDNAEEICKVDVTLLYFSGGGGGGGEIV